MIKLRKELRKESKARFDQQLHSETKIARFKSGCQL